MRQDIPEAAPTSRRLPRLAVAIASVVAGGLTGWLFLAAGEPPATPRVLVDDSTPAYYNAGIGTRLDGTGQQFPRADLADGDPTYPSLPEPNLGPAAGALGNWLGSKPPSGGSWSGPKPIPPSWDANAETAIVYRIDGGKGGVKNVVASFGVDNGVFVWVNGHYRFGAMAPGAAIPGDYKVKLGDLPPGFTYVQVLREDHGGANGYTVSITASMTSQIRIGHASLDLTDRLKRQRKMLKDKAVALGQKKLQLEGGVLAAEARANSAMAAQADLAAKQQALDSALSELRTALVKLRAEEATVPGVSALLDQESTIAQRLVEAESEGPGSAAKVAQLSKELDAVEAVLRDRLAGSPVADLRDAWVARIGALTTTIASTLGAQADARATLTAAELELTRLRSEIGPIDTSLMAIAEQLAVFRPQVIEIAAKADGQPVFHAAAGATYADLNKLNEEIGKQNAVIVRLKDANAGARDAFFAAAKDTIASGNRLAATLKALAYARFGTDLFFESVDIVQATAKGGVVGAVAELGKKLIEREILPQAGSGIEPGSPEDEVNKLYQAGLNDAWSTPALETTAMNRAIKETISKGTKDTLNQKLGAYIFDKVEFPIRFKLEVERRLVKGTASEYERAEKALQNLSKQAEKLKKGYAYSPKNIKADKAGTLTSLGETLVKEAAKTLVKGALDKAEHAAWLDYHEVSVIEKAYYPLYRAGISKISDAYELLDSMLVQKGQMLEGLPPQPGFQIDTTTPFNGNAQLEIKLFLQGQQDPADPLVVEVGGATAARQGSTNVYVVETAKARAETDGTLALVVK